MTEFNHLIEPFDFGQSVAGSEEEMNMKIIEQAKKKVVFEDVNQTMTEAKESVASLVSIDSTLILNN